ETKVTDNSGSATFNYTVTVTHDSGTDSGWQVNGTIEVLNPNDVDFTGVNVTDSINNDSNATCVVTGGSDASIPANTSVSFAYSCTYSGAPAANSETNTATATWDQSAFHTPDSSNQFSVGFQFDDGSAGNPTLVDACVNVTDTLGGSLGTACVSDPTNPTTFSYSYTVTGTPGTCVNQGNTASFTTNTTGTIGSASQTVTLCTPEDLQITKNVTPGFTRTFHWKIAKAVDKTLVEQIGGGMATFNYTVTVTQDGFTDSDWHAKGTITLNNPNDFEAITVLTVTDAVDNGGTCTVDTTGFPLPGSLPASGSVSLPYSCTYATSPTSKNGTNTATVTWDKQAAQTPAGSNSKNVPFAFDTGDPGNPNTVNQCVTINDSFAGTLGIVCGSTSSNTVKAFTYTRTVNVPTFNCVKYTNTAVIAETSQSASQTIEACGPAKTGALTMGFWQNKNGQGIIKGGSSTSGACNSGTWLSQFKPFQDL